MEENIPTFVAITDTTPEVAQGFLELAAGDVERAVALFFENPDLATTIGSSTAAAARPPPVPSSTRPRANIGREDASGVIHLDSDDEDGDGDANMSEAEDNDRAALEHAIALAQEEEDAAMAQRLQEELYGVGGAGGAAAGPGEDVRAPIARTTETLVAPNPLWGPDETMESAFLRQMREGRNAPSKIYG